ncbi:MAG: threonine ammonia-lyase, partial [Proteobacteria bacterium]|nr:threonine ammonia-lyase [Pseudomonadota bacterium]
VHSSSLSRMFGGEIYLKLENLQKTGSFKIRGATYTIMVNRANIGPGGVVAASAGNHAQGVALAASQAQLPATIVMPEWASITKQEATRAYGGEVVIAGQSLGESLKKAEDMIQAGKMFIHPFNDPDIITGQGTVALEILEDLRNTDMILVPVGGGGLISGIASVVKAVRPEVRVVGVQSSACPSAHEARRQGKLVRVDARQSIADVISVRQLGELNFEIIQKNVDDLVLVQEEDIAAAILLLLERKKILAEGAGAVTLAALLNGSVAVPRKGKTVLMISGGNVDSPLLGRILGQGLSKHGRIMRFKVTLDDRPGSLAQLLAVISELKANVLHIYHDRSERNLPIYVTRVDLEIETRSPAHVDEISRKLIEVGYELELR